ncbi:MAG: M56 family metallopeptidase, partial [Eubacteriales bacterium]
QWMGTQRLCRGAVRKEKRGTVSVCQLDGIPTPFARGIIRKRIYLPDTVLPDCAEGILLHEQAHFRRGDIIWRGLYCVCLCMFWFQPLLWLGQRYFLYDAECACDELALHELQKQANGGSPADVAVMRSIRADYAQTLLRHAKKTKSGVLSFGATGIKGRVNEVLHPKNLRAGGIAGALLAAFLVVAVMMVSSACADVYQNGGADKEHTAAEKNLVTITQTPTSTLYGYAEGYIEAHPDIWGACSVSFVLPDGWTIEERSARDGMIVDMDGTEKAEYRIVPFMPYDGEDEVPEGDWYKTVYAELRLSSMAVMRDYMPMNRNPENGRPVWENALAVWESEDEDFPDTATAAETRAVPMVLGYHEDCGMFLQIIFCDDSVPTDVRKTIAESIVFRRDEEKDTTAS